MVPLASTRATQLRLVGMNGLHKHLPLKLTRIPLVFRIQAFDLTSTKLCGMVTFLAPEVNQVEQLAGHARYTYPVTQLPIRQTFLLGVA